MKIKDIVVEGLGDWLDNLSKQRARAKWKSGGQEQYYSAQKPQQIPQEQLPTAVKSGHRLKVQLAKQPGQVAPAFVYKTGNVWTNELGQRIANPASITDLEAIANTGRLERIPVAQTVQQRKQQRRTK